MASRINTVLPSHDITFVSLGMAVLDELHLPDGTILHEVPGGSGLYSVLGARMAAGAVSAANVACFVLAGKDFPDSVTRSLEEWKMSLVIDRDETRMSTRSLLRYEGRDFEKRIFKYTTPTLQATPLNLKNTSFLKSKTLHFLTPPDAVREFASQFSDLRGDRVGTTSVPLFVWEPAPLSCTAVNQGAHLEAARLVDFYSPNHKELLSTFADIPSEESEFDRACIEKQALRVLGSGVGQAGEGVIVIRSAEHGCFVVSRSYPGRWFPPFHEQGSSKVVDATGAGNAFLGGFAVRFAESSDLTEATVAGSVAASFAIEQVGMAHLGHLNGRETWNGAEFSARVQQYKMQIK